MKNSVYKNLRKPLMLFLLVFPASLAALAQGPKLPSSVSNPFVLLLTIIMLLLALVIVFLAKMVIGSAGIFVEKAKQQAAATNTAAVKATVIIGTMLLSCGHLFAQDNATDTPKAVAAAPATISDTAFYLMGGVVFTEMLLIAVLLYMLGVFINVKKKAKAVAAGGPVAEAAKPSIKDAAQTWWDNFNKLRPLHEEVAIDLGHNYDGIRELDNRLPPWWLYGFFITIIFACGYLYMHYVSHSLPSNLEQYQAQVKEGEAEKAAYLAKAANNVDETTVKLLTDETSLAAGKQVFQTTCFPCHGKLGEGGVGPNLTDDYWLHGGTINEVFRTIKYGWPDKGMKSWKDDFSPVQIQQIASYVKSLHGTNPPNGKAPQGTLFTDGKAGAKDSSQIVKQG